MSQAVLQNIAKAFGFMSQEQGNDMRFKPFDTDKIVSLFGVPPVQLAGLDSITAKRSHPKAKFISNLGGGGTFLSNKNRHGEIRLTFIGSSWSLGHIEIFDFTKNPLPLLVTDLLTGGTSTVVGDACRVIDKGEWTRANQIPMVTITMGAKRLWFFHGVRLLNS